MSEKPYLSNASIMRYIVCNDLMGNRVEMQLETIIPSESALLSVMTTPWHSAREGNNHFTVALKFGDMLQLYGALTEILGIQK